MSEQVFEKEAYTTPVKAEMSGLHATLINDNYVNKFEASVSVVETQYSQSRYEANLNAPQFGSTSQAYLPTQAFIGETYLILTLKASDNTSTFTLPTGWGLRLINNITYTMPSDTVGQITITNDEMYHYLYCQSRDSASTTQLFGIMGPSIVAQTYPQFTSDPNAANWTATVLLPLPWCSLGRDTKPLDATIFGSGQIFINVTFAQPGSVYQVISGSGTLSISSATLTFRQGELSNRAFSLKALMLKNPHLIYDMPYIRSQFKSVGILTAEGGGINVDTSSGLCTAQTFISGLLNADLVGMCISAHYVPASGFVGNPYQAMKIYNLQVVFGGLTLYKSSQLSHALYNFQSALSAGYFVNDVNVGPSTPVESLPHIINFSRCRSMDWDDHYYNVMKWNAQTFNISFNLPNDFTNLVGSTTRPNITLNACEVRITCFYNAVFKLGQYRTQQMLL